MLKNSKNGTFLPLFRSLTPDKVPLRLAAAVLVAEFAYATRALVLNQCRHLPREQDALAARNECSKIQKRYHSAPHSLVYLWQNALARITAAVLVVGCSHLTLALVLTQSRDLRRVPRVIEARNEISKPQKRYISASHSLVYPRQSAFASVAAAVFVVGYMHMTRALDLDQ